MGSEMCIRDSDHTCRTSTHQHIRRYRSRFLDNTHRIRCSAYCISDHSIFQTNQIYTKHLNEVSNNLETREIRILQKKKHTHNVEFKIKSHKYCLKNRFEWYTNLQDKSSHQNCLMHTHRNRPMNGKNLLRIPSDYIVYMLCRKNRKDILIKR